MTTIKLLKHQYHAVYSPYRHTCLAGGVGSGKTYAGTQFVFKNLSEQPNVPGLIVANTYQQLRDVSVLALIQQFQEYDVPFTYNRNEMLIEVGNTPILCRSAEKHEHWKGIEIGWYWFDEAAYARRAAFETILARLRHPKAKRLHGLLTTTPKGYNWVYDFFVGDARTEEHHLINAKTTANRHLPTGFEDSIRGQYDDLLAKQELEGEFVNITAGKIYYAFNRDRHVKDVKMEPKHPIWVSIDFNVDPMTASVAQIRLIDGKQKLVIFDEFYLRNSNTEALSLAIKAKYGPDLTIVPDSTGIKRTTNANISDIQILKKHFTRVSPGINPFRVDRYAAVNGAFANDLVLVAPKCENLIRDLEVVTYKQGTDQPDVSQSHLLTHCSDNVGYLIYKTINPLRSGVKKISSQLR